MKDFFTRILKQVLLFEICGLKNKKNEEEAGHKTIFAFWYFFLKFNLKILPIWFCWVSRCQMKDFFTNFLKQVLLFKICGFKNCKIESEVVPIWVGHSVYWFPVPVQQNAQFVFMKHTTISQIFLINFFFSFEFVDHYQFGENLNDAQQEV